MSEWQPIETAPKDGQIILVWGYLYTYPVSVSWELYDDEVAAELNQIGFWKYADETLNELVDCDVENWTHWMPIPKPPTHTGETDDKG